MSLRTRQRAAIASAKLLRAGGSGPCCKRGSGPVPRATPRSIYKHQMVRECGTWACGVGSFFSTPSSLPGWYWKEMPLREGHLQGCFLFSLYPSVHAYILDRVRSPCFCVWVLRSCSCLDWPVRRFMALSWAASAAVASQGMRGVAKVGPSLHCLVSSERELGAFETVT